MTMNWSVVTPFLAAPVPGGPIPFGVSGAAIFAGIFVLSLLAITVATAFARRGRRAAWTPPPRPRGEVPRLPRLAHRGIP
jgi:hypothetical protein